MCLAKTGAMPQQEFRELRLAAEHRPVERRPVDITARAAIGHPSFTISRTASSRPLMARFGNCLSCPTVSAASRSGFSLDQSPGFAFVGARTGRHELLFVRQRFTRAALFQQSHHLGQPGAGGMAVGALPMKFSARGSAPASSSARTCAADLPR